MEGSTSVQQVIDDAYARLMAESSLKSGKLMALIALPATILFAFQDIAALGLDAATTLPWRSIGIFPLIIFLTLAARLFKTKEVNPTQLHALDIVGMQVMMAGLAFVIFTKPDADTTLKFGLVAGYIVTIFGVFALAGGARPLLKYLLPIPLLISLLALAFFGDMKSVDWGFLTNVVLAVAIAIVMSNRQTKLEKLEFSARKRLEISEMELKQEIDLRLEAEQALLKHQEHLESEVEKRTEELAEAKDEAVRMNYLKGIMLSSISHELVTPLNHITGAAELLAGETDPELIAEDAAILQETGSHLARTLNSIVSFSHLEANLVELNPQPISVEEVISNEITYFKNQASEKGLSLTLDMPPPNGALKVDKEILKQIVFCLVDNAIKFTEEGQVKVSYKVETPGDHMKEISLTVSDTGIGINEQFLKELYDPFRQESEGIARNFDGMGLGLALVSGYVKLLDGKVAVDSKKGKGTSFTINIPVSV